MEKENYEKQFEGWTGDEESVQEEIQRIEGGKQ